MNKLILILLVVIAITACSSRSSAGSNAGSVSTGLSFQPLVGTGTALPVMDIFSKDLNGDGIDEVLIVGRRTQPATDATWQNFNMQVFGWNTGSFANETTTWFPAGINVIVGSEPSVQFGDFDNDGHIDMFVAASTDMYDVGASQTIRGDSIAFMSNGSYFSKNVVETGSTWSHGSVAHDFTGDGKPDVMVTDYSGHAAIFYYDGTWKKLAGSNVYSSDVTVGDLVAGGNSEVILTDDGSTNDRAIYSYSVNTGASTFALTKIADLPAEQTGYLHTIRSIAVDFDGVNGIDLIAFSRDNNNAGGSFVQFLKNNGSGVLSDVTSTFLTAYNGNNGGVNYQPIVKDVNNDTFNDIILSGTDFDGTYDSTQILLNNGANSLYTGSYVSNFAANWNAKKAATSNADSSGQIQHIVLGPSNNYYIVTTVLYTTNGTINAAIYTTSIGTTISTGL